MSSQRSSILLSVVGLAVIGSVALSLSPDGPLAEARQHSGPSDAAASTSGAASTPEDSPPLVELVAVELPDCETVSPGTPSEKRVDPRTRASAQKGLDFLSGAATTWQTQHDCYGCHVQAVTTEALAVGIQKSYEVDDAALEAMVRGLTSGKGGARADGGFQYHGGTLLAPSKAFGGAALARYDALVDGQLTDDLLSVAQDLKQYQADDGALRDPGNWVNLPVGQGELQFTWQAIATWRQAYERSADPIWLTAVAEAEDYLSGQLATVSSDTSIQPTTYALLGMADAGASLEEATVRALVADLEARQTEGGGWAMQRGGTPDAFATGQALYTLRVVGLSDGHPAIDSGTAWLVDQQSSDGSWGHGGDEKAKAMWAVLGMVSVDALHVSLAGVSHGQHVDGVVPLEVDVGDTEGSGVRSVTLLVDDVPVAGDCGATLTHSLDTRSLSSGLHVLEVVATDGEGRATRRATDIYTGDHYLGDAGSSWDDGGTAISFRNLAPPTTANSVRLRIHTLDGGAEGPVPGAAVAEMDAEGRQGAMRFWWDGAEIEGAKLAPDTRYRAELAFLDADGQVRHITTTDFVHTDPRIASQWYGQVNGKVDLPDARGSANTWVELVDGAGHVVDKVLTTREGQYRFKDVADGDYEVRVKKGGFGSTSAPVSASAGDDANADLEF